MSLRNLPLLLSALAGAGVAAFSGCYLSTPTEDSSTACLDNRQYFEREVWGAFMQANCGRCHTPGGTAVDRGAKLVLQNASYPGFVDENLSALREMSKYSYDGKPLVLQKALGNANHGGGKVLEESSPEYAKLQSLVSRLASGGAGGSCGPQASPLLGVQMLSPSDTLRKAAIDLAGRLPTQAEADAVKAGGEAALPAAIDGLMKERTFLERVREMYNDVMLTDSGLQYTGRAIDFTNAEIYPGLAAYKSLSYSDPKRPLANQALAREPLDLIAYIVDKGKPFTEVLTADYTVVNPYTAAIYGVDASGFANPNDYDQWKEVKVQYQGTKPGPVAHAGVLSTPSFLNRWQTTPTNRNRARARRVFQFFLATDVLKLAERPVDASKLTAIQNPTQNSQFCSVCHKTIDPLAGAFRGYNEFDYERFDPSDPWHSDMDAPGFSGQQMDPAYYGKALQWVTPKLAQDPRFALGAVYAAYQGLTGRKPISYPTNTSDPRYSQIIQGWEVQDAFFRQLSEDFVKSNFDFKSLVRAIVLSPFYRGVAYSPDVKDSTALDASELGIGEMLPPEALNRKIVAVTGAHWRKDYDYAKNHDWLVEDFPILYGGIDSDSVTERTRVPNGVMASVMVRMSNELSCRLTAWDFTIAQGQRRFFPKVNPDQVPMSANAEVPGSVAAIKENIRHLHALVLGEQLDVADPEIERTYKVFIDTWKELSTAGKTGLDYSCWGRSDPLTGVALPDQARITEDKNFTIRAWGAVLSYLLGDWKFSHQ